LLALPSPCVTARCVAYGIGDAGTGMAAALIGFYLFVFYYQNPGLPPWLAGLVLMVGRLLAMPSNDQLRVGSAIAPDRASAPRVPWD